MHSFSLKYLMLLSTAVSLMPNSATSSALVMLGLCLISEIILSRRIQSMFFDYRVVTNLIANLITNLPVAIERNRHGYRAVPEFKCTPRIAFDDLLGGALITQVINQ